MKFSHHFIIYRTFQYCVEHGGDFYSQIKMNKFESVKRNQEKNS